MSDKKTDVNKKNEIERGIETNYLILDLIVNDYRLGMITENKIPGLLSASLKDEKVRYDISSDMNLKSYMESKSFDAEGIRKVIESVSQVLKKCRVYLLEPEDSPFVETATRAVDLSDLKFGRNYKAEE